MRATGGRGGMVVVTVFDVVVVTAFDVVVVTAFDVVVSKGPIVLVNVLLF